MQLFHRSLLLGACALLLLSACKMDSPWGSSGVGSDYGTNPVASGSGDKLAPSIALPVIFRRTVFSGL